MVEFGCQQVHLSVGGHRQARFRTSGARKMRLEATDHPIHHRRVTVCARRCTSEHAVLQRVVGLNSRLKTTLRPGRAQRCLPVRHAADGLPRRGRYRGASLGRTGAFSQITTTYVWNKSVRVPLPVRRSGFICQYIKRNNNFQFCVDCGGEARAGGN